jgi:hypothetical protein
MVHTCNMNLFRRAGLLVSLLLVPVLVLNPVPAFAEVLPAGSLDSSYGNGGYVNFGETVVPYGDGALELSDGSIALPVNIEDGLDTAVAIQFLGPNGEDNGLSSALLSGSGFSVINTISLAFDSLGNDWVLFTNTTAGPAIVHMNWEDTELDPSFSGDGVSLLYPLIKQAIRSTSPYTGIIDSSINIGFLDIGLSADGSVFLLGTIRVTGATDLNSDLVLWRFLPNGLLDEDFAQTADKGKRFSAQEGYVPGFFEDDAKIVFDPSRTEMSVVAGAEVPSDPSQSKEFFVQKFDVSDGEFTIIEIMGNPYFLSQLGWSSSRFNIYDAAESGDGKMLIVGEECFSVNEACEFWSITFRLNLNSGSFLPVENQLGCYNSRVAFDQNDSATVSGYCSGNTTFFPSLVRVLKNGIVDPSFSFSLSSLIQDELSSAEVVDVVPMSDRTVVVGRIDGGIGGCGGVEISGCALSGSTGRLFATALRSSPYTVPAPTTPAPAPVVAPAPAPIVAPALPTQSAPVAIAAIVKAKKKIKFPLNSAAGNPLIVRVSGSCSLSPVFKKVKVKVGKKTKRVKQQTGWTVQMKKKKKTCTITQTDAGGNGYAALSSTSTVTIK